MTSNDYHFITHWRVPGTIQEIFEIIANAPDLVRWWPSVYLDVQQLQPGDASGVGKIVKLYTKGWLPYTLRWQFRVTEVHVPYDFTLEAWGDFVGRGVWTFEQEGPWVNITYDWRIRADKPLLRYISFLFKPLFAANHRWAMARGEESLGWNWPVAMPVLLRSERSFLPSRPNDHFAHSAVAAERRHHRGWRRFDLLYGAKIKRSEESSQAIAHHR
ncbi:MAG: polyketide cyclase [Anaerolineales bacterium]|nr:polyketide cyclase [Anaerolineales bacterium]